MLLVFPSLGICRDCTQYFGADLFLELPFIIPALHPKPENYWLDKEQACSIVPHHLPSAGFFRHAIAPPLDRQSRPSLDRGGQPGELQFSVAHPHISLSLNPDLQEFANLFHPEKGQITIPRV